MRHESPTTGRIPTLPGPHLTLMGLSGMFASAWLVERSVEGLCLTLKLPILLSFDGTVGTVQMHELPCDAKMQRRATSASLLGVESAEDARCTARSRVRIG